jgi:hypothetical protein
MGKQHPYPDALLFMCVDVTQKDQSTEHRAQSSSSIIIIIIIIIIVIDWNDQSTVRGVVSSWTPRPALFPPPQHPHNLCTFRRRLQRGESVTKRLLPMDACSSITPSATLQGRLEHLARYYICSPSLPECDDSHKLAHSGGGWQPQAPTGTEQCTRVFS